jgi:hypothetical protein
MSLAMSGDAGGLLGLLMMRPLLAGLLGLPTPAGTTGMAGTAMTEAQFRNALGRALNEAVVAGITATNPMTKADADLIIKELQKVVAAVGKLSMQGAAPARSRELERARAVVARLAAEGARQTNGQATPADLDRARATVARLAAAGARQTNGRAAPADLARAREVVARLAAEGSARPAGPTSRPAATAVASGAK